MSNYTDWIKDKCFLVTGAGGSIGSEICRELVRHGARQIRLVGHSEEPLYRIDQELMACKVAWDVKCQIVPILASCADEHAMMNALEGVDVVIHAAAHKHVPLCEQNPLEAILNNVGGTIALAQSAHRRDVKQFVLISSDKAVKPASVMGMTKRACELYLRFQSARSSTKFTTVRFGNVLNSAGSVLPLWRDQLARDEQITITDKRCTRFFMSIPEAAALTLAAAAMRRPDGLYVLDMGAPQSIYRLALETVMKEKPFLDETDAQGWIKEIGLRPGEKIEEELTYDGERVATAVPRVMLVRNERYERVQRWNDFPALMQAARVGATSVALQQLKEIVS